MNRLSVLLSASLAAAALSSPASAQIRLTNPDNTAQGRFGAALAISGSRILVGAPAASVGGIASGAVYVFNGFTGSYQGRISPTSPVIGDRFGESLAVIGDRVYIGSPGRLQSGLSSGRVYYSSLPVVGSQSTNSYVAAPDATSNSNFGTSVAAKGSILLVGAPGADSGLGRGRVYAWSNPTGIPVYMYSFASSVTVQDGNFGQAVAISGSNRLIVSTPMYPEAGAQSGVGYVFNTSNPPSQLRKLRPPGVGAFSQFGASLAVQGSVALLGAPDEEAGSGTTNVGAVYIVNVDTGGLLSRVQPASLGNTGRLGTSVAFSGSYAAAGAPYANTSAQEAGAFLVFNPFSPGEPEPISPGGLNEAARFGAAVALGAPFVAVGAPEANVNGSAKAGSVYIYRLDAPPLAVRPKPKTLRSRTHRVLIKGTASGGFVGVAKVEYATKRAGKYTPLNGTSRWRGKAKIKATTRALFVRAVDFAGNFSPTARIRVKH